MAEVHQLEVKIELKSCADKLWRSMKEFVMLFPIAVPDIYESIQVLEGDGKSAGSIFVSTFKPGTKYAMPTAKERIEVVDEGRRVLSYSFVDGEIMKSYKSFKASVSVREKTGDGVGVGVDVGGGSILTYSAEIEKANEQVPDPDFIKEVVAKVYQDLDAYLLKTP